MADSLDGKAAIRRLEDLERALSLRANDLAVFLVFDRPSLVAERPGLARTFFAERCVPDEQLQRMLAALHEVGIQAEIFEGDHDFVAALADGLHKRTGKSLQVAYNGLGYSVGVGAFQRGRKSLIPLIADSYGLLCANSDAYTCALAMHKFHSFTLLGTLGVRVPRTWLYSLDDGWLRNPPPVGTRVIAKSTYESWAIGVTDGSVFVVDDSSTCRLAKIANSIGQEVTVQEFISGPEVYVPVLSCPELVAGPPVESVLARSPGDTEAFVTIDDNLTDRAVFYRRFKSTARVDQLLRNRAREVFRLLQLEGVGRVDFRVDANGEPWVFDIAISPGLEDGGSTFQSLTEYEFDYPSFIRLVFGSTLATRGFLDA